MVLLLVFLRNQQNDLGTVKPDAHAEWLAGYQRRRCWKRSVQVCQSPLALHVCFSWCSGDVGMNKRGLKGNHQLDGL